MAKSKGEFPPGEPEAEKFPGVVPMDPGLLANLNALTQEKSKAIETAEAKPPVRRKLDPELKAMDAVCEILEEFPPDVQMRILNWGMNKFFSAKSINKVPPNGTGVDESGP